MFSPQSEKPLSYGGGSPNGRKVTALRKLFNFAGCLLILPCYYVTTLHTVYPLTLDVLISVMLTEYNRWANEGRRIAFHEQQPSTPKTYNDEKFDFEAQHEGVSGDCMAAVVGYREDPALFGRALESYKTTRGCTFLLVGIDGDDALDKEMRDVFDRTYPVTSAQIHVSEPFGEIARSIQDEQVALCKRKGLPVNMEAINELALRHCIGLAEDLLAKQPFTIGGPSGITQLCIYQPHLHKKGIMFTTFIFCLVISDILGVEFLWSSDSDTLVFEDSIERTITTVAGDPKAGGASSGLVVHNGDDTIPTKLASAVYWCELYLTRSVPACGATSDCQSGPSTAFRLAALRGILVSWYTQVVFKKKMVINEDRHLTTNLLLRGWSVIYASDVLTATETPQTVARWIRQQVRWARATHIESLLLPSIYIINSPILFYAAVKREIGPLVVLLSVLLYLFTDIQLLTFHFEDMAFRFVVTAIYNILRNPDRISGNNILWILPGLMFYNIPLPAIQLWSLLTLTEGGWGTSMRSSITLARKEGMGQKWFETGFFVVWMGIIGATFAKYVAARLLLLSSDGPKIMAIITSAMVCAFVAWKITIQNA